MLHKDHMQKKLKGFTKLLFIVSLLVNFLLISFFAGKRIFYSNRNFFYRYSIYRPAVKPNSSWNTFLRSKPDSAEIIFSGTSLTLGFQLQAVFNNSHIRNMSFGGNRTSHILWQVSKYIGRKPSKLFLEAGINDFRYGIDPDTTYSNFTKICTLIKTNSPQTKLYVQSVLPTYNNKLNTDICLYNKKMAAFCKRTAITYVDLYPYFIKGTLMNNSLTTDGIHLNESGYYLWKRLIEHEVYE